MPAHSSCRESCLSTSSLTPVDLDALTPTQWAQVEAARRAYLNAMSIKATKTRRLRRAARLREHAAVIEAEVAESGDGL